MHNGRALKKADPSTIQDKLLVGYQGWFTCAGDGEPVGRGHHGWLHWFNYPVPDGGRPNTDIWPDVSEYGSSELYEAPGLKTQSGEKCYLFSSRNQKTVDRHFNWMAQHGVDGAFLQRFAGQCDGSAESDGIRRIRDEVGDRVQEAAEKNGRAYAIMYDVSGVPPDRIEEIIKYDWKHLLFDKRIFDSPSYFREKGKPVVALWGFGFEDSRHTPGLVRSIASYINNSHPGGVYLMAGVPAHWRTSTGDADRNPEFVDVWLDCFDAISPWTIGRYGNIADADKFAEEKIAEDMKLISERNKTVRSQRKLDYIPVVFPGGSGYNLSEGKWAFNDAPREGGRFLWRQVYNARRNGVRTVYGAMWDEYDEGTALMPIVTHKNQLPLPVRDQYRFLAPDAGTYDLPSDWYMRVCGMAAEILHGDRRLVETFPHKELQDYWGPRPRYEDGTSGGYVPADSTPKAGGSGSVHVLPPEENPNEPPPPPYTLEENSPSPTNDGFSTAPTSPSDKQDHSVSDLANDFGRHTLGSPSTHSSSHPHIPGGFDNMSSTTGNPMSAFANRPTSQSPAPLTTPPMSTSYFSPPFGPSHDGGMPSVTFPHVEHGSYPHHASVNLNTPFHWNGEYTNPQSQPYGGYNPNAPSNPWGPPASAKPHEAPFQSGYQPGYGPPPLHPSHHARPPVHAGSLPPQSPHEGIGTLHSSPSFSKPGGSHPPYPPPQSTYPGQVGPGSYYGYDQKTDGKGQDVWGGPPPSNSPYPGPPTSGQGPPPGHSPYPGPGCMQQPLYPGKTHSGHPPSNSPPLSQGYGHHQSTYAGMANPPVPGPQDRPPTRPPTSHTSRPTTPYHQSGLPPQVQPPLPSGPAQSTYGGMKPGASPPIGPSPHGYQQPPQHQQSTYPGYKPPPPGTSPYPGYPGSHPHPPPPCRHDKPPSRPNSSSGPVGPGFNQTPHQPHCLSQQQQPQGYGGHTTGLSHSASTSSSYQNATASWKKQQTGVMGLAKDAVDMVAGKGTRKSMQASVQGVLKPFLK